MSDRVAGLRASALFLALAGIPQSERAAWLDAQCAGDADLRREVEALLAALDAPSEFLDPAGLHPPALDTDTPLLPGTRLGDFTIQRTIASGSAGIVYSAVQRRPRRSVALKVLRQGLAASSARRRFEVEAELLAHLHHPGIAHIYAAHAGDEVTPPFIAMELVEGPPVTEFVQSAGLDVRGRVELVARICDAVQHAHQRGVIHRDLKPGNVLVGRAGQPKIVDFGVARASGGIVALTTISTEAGQLVGTVPYMSPEQLTAVPDDIDTRTDVYALGVILFRLLTGRLPFAAGDPTLPELARRIAQDDPPRLGHVDPSLSGDLETIIARALAKEKERRYPSAADLAADLRRWLTGQPVLASGDSAWYLVRRRLARYRRALAASVVAAIMLGALSIYAVLQRSRAETMNVQLAEELSASNVERARLLSRAGNLLGAEELLWHELLENPDSPHARWTLWEVYSREPSIWTRVIDSAGIDIVRFDGAGRLIAGGTDGRIRVIDPGTGDTRQVLEGHTGPVTGIAGFAGGPLVSAGADGVRVWSDDATSRLIAAGPSELTSLVSLGPDTLAVAREGRATVWSARDGRLVHALPAENHPVRRLAYSPVLRLLVAGSTGGEVIAWDARNWQVRWRVTLEPSNVTALAFNPSSGELVAGLDQQLAVLDGRTGVVLRRAAPGNGSVRGLSFDAGGQRLAIAGWWRTLVWDVATNRLEETGVSLGSWRAALSGDGRLLATTDGPGGTVRLWDLDADPRITYARAHVDRIVGLEAVGAPEPLLASASVGGGLRVQRQDGSDAGVVTSAVAGIVGIATLGEHVIVLHSRGELSAWRAAPAARLSTTYLPPPEEAAVSALATAGEGGVVFVGRTDGHVSTWRWDGQHFAPGRGFDTGDGEIIQIAERGGRLATAHRSGMVVLRDRSTGRGLLRLEPASTPFALAFNPDGLSLAVGTWTGVVEIWDAVEPRRIRSLTGHSRLVSDLDFSADGALLASANRDGTVRLWETATGRPLATIASRQAGASRVLFLPGDRLAVGYDDGELETRDLGYFFPHVAGQAGYQRALLERTRGRSYPRGAEIGAAR